jgi:hypothetical protein
MELSRLYNSKLVSINKSIDKIQIVFEKFGREINVEFEGYTFETSSIILGKKLVRYSDSFSLGMKSIDYLRKNRIRELSQFKQVTFEFERDGHYKNEIICLYKRRGIGIGIKTTANNVYKK